MPHVLRSLVVVAALASAGWTQAGPDLSGSWTLDDDGGAPPTVPASATNDGPPPPPPPPRQVALKIVQTQAAFRIERSLSTAGSTSVQGATYTLDGSETTSRMGPIVSTTSASWDGRELVLSTVQTAAGATGPVAGQVIGSLRERFRLEDGRLVVDTERVVIKFDRTSGRQSSDRMVYTRVQ